MSPHPFAKILRTAAVFSVTFAWGLALLAGLASDAYFLVVLRVLDVNGRPEPDDFGGFWAAGFQALHGQASSAYDWAAHWAAEQHVFGPAVAHHPWIYPPIFLLVVTPFALLSFGWSRLLWLTATLTGYLAAIRAFAEHRLWLVFALAFGGVAVNLGFGSNGFLSAALLGGGLFLLDRNPLAAGALFGALSYKPQLGLLVPIALIAGRQWRALAAAAATVLALCGLTALFFGPETWLAFTNTLGRTRSDIMDGAPGLNMITVYAAVRRLGGAPVLTWAVQGVASLACAVITFRAWRQPGSRALKGALLVALTPLATPYLYDYDLPILALPIAVLMSESVRTGMLTWEQPVLALAFVFPLACIYWIPTVVFGPLMALGLAVPLLRRLAAGAAALPQPAAPR